MLQEYELQGPYEMRDLYFIREINSHINTGIRWDHNYCNNNFQHPESYTIASTRENFLTCDIHL